MPERLTQDEKAGLRAEIERLREEHRDLDAAIEAMHRVGTVDQLQMQRLKKRRLVLRDKLNFAENLLIPDIIA